MSPELVGIAVCVALSCAEPDGYVLELNDQVVAVNNREPRFLVDAATDPLIPGLYRYRARAVRAGEPAGAGDPWDFCVGRVTVDCWTPDGTLETVCEPERARFARCACEARGLVLDEATRRCELPEPIGAEDPDGFGRLTRPGPG